MPSPVGGNKLVGAAVTYNNTPNSVYAAGTVAYLDNSLSDWDVNTGSVIDNQVYDIESFYGAYTGWNLVAGSLNICTIDVGSAVGGDLFIVSGYYGTGTVTRPTAAELEYSDNGTDWTTVEDRTGLTGGGGPGSHGWIQTFDVSAEGDHQYWRVTLVQGGAWTMIGELSLQ